MTPRILNGHTCANKVKAHVKEAIRLRQEKGLSLPGLSVILVGNNPASEAYIFHKEHACRTVGIRSTVYRMPETVTESDLAVKIDECNADLNTHGILLQLPLPEHINHTNLSERICPKKDVDAFHPYNLGRLIQRRPALRPCTAHGIMTLLKETRETIAGKHAVIVGASNIVGRPMAMELLLAKCTVTICHRFTENLAQHINNADLLIVAIGKPGIIQSKWIKPGTIVVDVGFSRLSPDKIVGDIHFETAKEKASWITPVPGGVGPMTVATLLENTLWAANDLSKKHYCN
ncbi:bifunctional methylenetetrahydrofolate dehydrogenase/methenyltetrahydrofolate cyclohydrolase FolD [Coxiella endosymbiont of Amblyomma nuttalli]|uniref:bifunctional methylenetetrahydrofolate dehydrogenase/methenyltetrahydrofolate cyclohydrolase FolD n=1 Tax=Coxiella endosymbiont of Amblyomma nuttalli TaxID=2749996 RepID=UPI001BA99FC7|nr:bifunctional methylenetetrahydrofolate dehydrogenase/methenyltetrahydrofolate cyclohydrolase FolD [Coxiella endosymbiont of Amblyomma nuttalli]QTS83838.1 Bifunctional protein FolD protein [Coxiella endosymbiont of Amblyomma nuttalli]